ncbi:hypothetical protein LZ554_007450 [Drepanopeziza brunnea f. sp. 'monogermtubi']|nr:hypothetical protein LZ554_007450 [Drepanopeziza brunnea f. sp. 'monogermtubi']
MEPPAQVNGPELKMEPPAQVNEPHPQTMVESVVGIVSGAPSKRGFSSLDESEFGSDDGPPGKRIKQSPGNDSEELNGAAEEQVISTPPPARLNAIKECIDSQFSLEILIKHQELRLIEQEIGKCRIALEQLRRVHLIPFPTSSTNPLTLSNVSDGVGPAVGSKGRVPKWAPPFGVTDGPYSKHYTKWLIPDPGFDGLQAEASERPRAGKSVPDSRIRNSLSDGIPANKSRSQRGSTSQNLSALPSGYPPVKEKPGPCVVKRGDGQWVKLICRDCQRLDFSSTQGFINHCRISHRNDYKSHEEAALDAGHPCEVDKDGKFIGEEKSPAPTPGVHPMVRDAPFTKQAYSALMSHIQSSLALYDQGKISGVDAMTGASSILRRRQVPATPSKDFVPSSSTPHLSELMRNSGFAGNLEQIVADAKAPINWEEEEESDGAEETTPDKVVSDGPRNMPVGGDGAASPLPTMRTPARVCVSPAPLGRPSSSKGTDVRHPGLSGISQRPSHATPVLSTAPVLHNRPSSRFGQVDGSSDERRQEIDIDMDMMHGSSRIDLSPNTVSSHNAPSLVSDDGEYDEGDDAESARSHSEDEDSDVAEIKLDDDNVEKVIPRTVLMGRAGNGLSKDERHVTFVKAEKGRLQA